MATSTDIGNRALQLVGTRSNIASLVELSNEAQQVNLAYSSVQDWCFGLANWNFARNTAGLAQVKGPPTLPTWSTSTSPSPPWLYEYSLPTDFIRAIYLTNTDVNTSATAFLGEPKRFALSTDTISSVQQEVLLTNETVAILVYTSRVTDPTLWPWYFERLAVIALASTICMALTGDHRLWAELMQNLEQQINISMQMNKIEGLMIEDTTPEWIQALGINYPYRRIDGRNVPDPTPAQQPRGR
jgi:hypothetical protein